MADAPTVPIKPEDVPSWVKPAFGFCALAIFMVALVASIKIEGDIRTMMFQATIGLTTGAVLYWFQSSASSAKKEDAATATNAQAISALAASAPTDSAPSEAAKAAKEAIAATPVPAT